MPTDFLRLFQILEAARSRFVLVGGLASLLHGVGRTTTDIDLAFDFAADSALPALDALAAAGYRPAAPVKPHDLADPAQRARWQRDQSMVVFSFWDSRNQMPTVDILLDPAITFDTLWRDAIPMSLQGTTVPVASIPHLIELKRRSGRPQDLADIVALERIAGQAGR